MTRRRPFLLLACLALLAGGGAGSRADGLPDLGESAQTDLPPQAEKKIGEAIMREIRLREPSFLDDPEVAAYLGRLGQRLIAAGEPSGRQFEFFALNEPSLNAFAMPGGYIGVHTALVVAAESESELAGVLAHEIAHVTQRHLARMVSASQQGQMAALLSLAVAILAARNNPDLAMGAAIAGQAAGIQRQLNYSRDFEREADRLGLQMLEAAGFDIRGMGSFFDRLMKVSRLYENNAPGYLRTHPLTQERIADIGSRIELRPYRQVTDSLDFLLVKAKLRAQQGSAHEAVLAFEHLLAERKFPSEAAARYGLARALQRNRALPAAEAQVAELRRLKVASPMVDLLAAELRRAQNDHSGAVRILRESLARYPEGRACAYALVESLLALRRIDEAQRFLAADLAGHSTDYRMRALQAQAYALQGKRLRQHWALGDAYALQGLLLPAIEQYELAQRAPDGDFYEHSQVDARMRDAKVRRAEALKQKGKFD